MIDSGTGSLKNLAETASVQVVDAVVNTHRHPDHISDLLPFIQDKVVRSFSSEEQDLEIYGPEGQKEYLEDRMRHEMMEHPSDIREKFGFDLSVKNLEASQSIVDFSVESLEALHGPEGFKCVSLKFSLNGKVVVFTGDTDYNPELESFAEGADLLVTDCSRSGSEEVSGHMNVGECATLAEKAGVDRLLLSHLYPQAEEHDLKSQASEKFAGEVVVAEDLMSLEI